MGLSAIDTTYDSNGHLLYGPLGVAESRVPQRLRASHELKPTWYDDMDLQVLAGNQQLGFWTLAAFM